MLAIFILVGVFYVALNYAEKYDEPRSKSFPSTSMKSFKSCERQLDKSKDVSARY